MRAGHVSNWTGAVVVTVAFLVGCNPLGEPQETSSTDTSWESSTDLVSEYGGYTFTDEAANFGESTFLKMEFEENAVGVADPDTTPTPDAFLVRILWGQLQGNRDATQVIDWSGTLTVDSGRLTVVRTLAFEPRTDRLLPRDDRQVVPFESKTLSHFDGLLLLIHDADSNPAATLTLSTAPIEVSWTFEELRNANAVLRVDDLGNAVSITGLPLPDDAACLGGAVRGQWQQDAGQRGVFRGVWMSRLGRPLGYIRGHFGVTDAGAHVWFGKIIGRDGRLIGLARGAFEPDSDGPGGHFAGHWAAQEGKRSGSILGHFLPGRNGERVGGYFQARWQSNCEGTPDPVPVDGNLL